MTAITLPNAFKPRWYQRPFMSYLDNGGKRAMWVVHRRGGKDLTAMHQTCKLAHRRRATYWHVFPTAEQGRKALWEGFTKDGDRIMEQVFPAPIRKSPREFRPQGEMVVELKCGSIWRLLGSDHMEVVGAGPAGVVFSEFALSRPKTWDLVRPMLRENEGWAAFITTPRGNNHAKKLFDMARRDASWFCELLTLRDTNAYDPEKTMAEERAEGMPEELIRQEYLCDWAAANVGAVYGSLLSDLESVGLVGQDFQHPTDGLFVTFDLGVSDATSMWWWRPNAAGGVDFVDYYEATGQGLSHFIQQIHQREDEGWKHLRLVIPHDARHRHLTGNTVEEQLEESFPGKVDVLPALPLEDGLSSTRWLLQRPCRFHPRTAEGVEALKAYSYAWDDDRKVFSRKPMHDWTSHAADAARYVATYAKRGELLAQAETPAPAPKPKTLNEYTLEDFYAMAPALKSGRVA